MSTRVKFDCHISVEMLIESLDHYANQHYLFHAHGIIPKARMKFVNSKGISNQVDRIDVNPSAARQTMTPVYLFAPRSLLLTVLGGDLDVVPTLLFGVGVYIVFYIVLYCILYCLVHCLLFKFKL